MSKSASLEGSWSFPLITVFFLSPVLTTAAPRVTWLFLSIIAVSLIATALRRAGEWRPLTHVNSTFVALLLVVVYVFLNATWAADPGTALGKAVLSLAVLVSTYAASKSIPRLDDQQLRSAAVAFTAGTFIAALFLTFELLTDGALTRMVLNSITLLQRLNAKHVKISHGQIVHINLSNLNQNVAILMFGLWSGLLALKTIEGGTRRSIFMAVFFAAVAVPVIISEHQSSQVALVVSIGIFCLAWIWRAPVIRSLAALWCIAFLLVLPIDFLAYKAELHMAPWLPSSFRARVIIWEYTAERTLDHPWLGIGANSTRALQESRVSAEQPPGFVSPRTTGWHSHDLFLQTWYELGVIGAILIAVAGAMVALRMSRLPAEAQPFAAASFAVFMVMASFAWGMWQTWLICGVALLLLYLLTAAQVARREGRRMVASGEGVVNTT